MTRRQKHLDIRSRWERRKDAHIQRYKEQRAALIAKLGGQCVDCGTADGLEFDHVEPRTWVASRKNRWTRLAMYRREAAEGKIELRCKRCNQMKGVPPEPPVLDEEGNPIDPLTEEGEGW